MSQPAPTARKTYLKDLILLFAVPIAIAFIAALAVYIPRLLANPTYDFVYSTCDNYACRGEYRINQDGRISYEANSSIDTNFANEPTLHYYTTVTNSSKMIDTDEARQFTLLKDTVAPDGYTLEKENSQTGLLFWNEYNSGWYLKDGMKKQELRIATADEYYSTNITFLGWVQK